MYTMWTSVGSILFGLIALLAPIISKRGKNRPAYTAVSFGACSLSLCIQIYYAAVLVGLEDWQGLIDTIDVVAFVSTALVAMTIALNLWALCSGAKRKSGKGQ